MKFFNPYNTTRALPLCLFVAFGLIHVSTTATVVRREDIKHYTTQLKNAIEDGDTNEMEAIFAEINKPLAEAVILDTTTLGQTPLYLIINPSLKTYVINNINSFFDEIDKIDDEHHSLAKRVLMTKDDALGHTPLLATCPYANNAEVAQAILEKINTIDDDHHSLAKKALTDRDSYGLTPLTAVCFFANNSVMPVIIDEINKIKHVLDRKELEQQFKHAEKNLNKFQNSAVINNMKALLEQTRDSLKDIRERKE